MRETFTVQAVPGIRSSRPEVRSRYGPRCTDGNLVVLRILTALVFLISPAPSFAQKAPELGYLSPPVLQAGTTTEVLLGGYDFTPDMQLFVHDERCRVEILAPPGEFIIPPPPYWFGEKGRSSAFPIPREIRARITIPPDCPPGPVRWQVANANGASATALFLVSDGHEILEQRDRDRPQRIETLPAAVSGRLSRIAEVDRYQLTPARDGPVTVELFARRLGADFNGVIEVRDENGRLIADSADTEGRDTAVTFRAVAGQTCTVSLHDVDFRGNRAFVYRLAITPGPRVLATLPVSIPASGPQRMTFIGPGVETGSAQIEATTRTVTVPNGLVQKSYDYHLETAFGVSPIVHLPIASVAEISFLPQSAKMLFSGESAESQPGRSSQRDVTPAEPIALDGPCLFTSLLDSTATASWTWHADKGEYWSVGAESQALGTGLDLALSIFDATGKQIAAADDLPHTTDPSLQFKVPTDGVYRCVLSDLSGHSGRPTSIYRLELRRAAPDFRLSVPQTVNVPVGGKTSFQVDVERLGGFNEPIAITFDGLPDGVSPTGDLTVPAGKNALKVTLEASPESPARAAFFTVEGTAGLNTESSDTSVTTLTRTATAIAAGNLCPRSDRETRVSQILLATTLSPKFSVELVDKNRQRAVHRGTTYPAPFRIRRDEGFTGEVTLQMASRQGRHRQGIHGPILTVPADVDEALYPCFMPEWLETDRTTRMVVLGVAQQPDPTGQLRYVTQPADARITMILEGALLKVEHSAGERTIPLGQTFNVPVHVSRSAKLQTPVTLTLAVPEALRGLVSLEEGDVKLPTSQSDAVLRVATRGTAEQIGRWTVQIEAHTLENDQWRVLSQTDLTFDLVGPRSTESADASE